MTKENTGYALRPHWSFFCSACPHTGFFRAVHAIFTEDLVRARELASKSIAADGILVQDYGFSEQRRLEGACEFS